MTRFPKFFFLKFQDAVDKRDRVGVFLVLSSTTEGPDERHKRMVELNVIEQCLNLFKTSTWPNEDVVVWGCLFGPVGVLKPKTSGNVDQA